MASLVASCLAAYVLKGILWDMQYDAVSSLKSNRKLQTAPVTEPRVVYAGSRRRSPSDMRKFYGVPSSITGPYLVELSPIPGALVETT